MYKAYHLPEQSDSKVEGQYFGKLALRLGASFAFGPPLSEENFCFYLSVIQLKQGLRSSRRDAENKGLELRSRPLFSGHFYSFA